MCESLQYKLLDPLIYNTHLLSYRRYLGTSSSLVTQSPRRRSQSRSRRVNEDSDVVVASQPMYICDFRCGGWAKIRTKLSSGRSRGRTALDTVPGRVDESWLADRPLEKLGEMQDTTNEMAANVQAFSANISKTSSEAQREQRAASGGSGGGGKKRFGLF